MDFLFRLPDLEQTSRTFEQGAEQYLEVAQALQQISSMFENGGLMGEVGLNFNQLLARDIGFMQEFADVFQQAVGHFGAVMAIVDEIEQELRNRMPG